LPAKPAGDAYVTGLRLLGRRELSEAQLRQRLARRGHSDSDIDDAIARLKAERAVDDERVAAAIARTETAVKRRGKLRVKRQIASAGIASSTAKRALDETFADIDEDALLEGALARRLRGRDTVTRLELQRLYRYLIGQGFEPDRVSQRLRRIALQ
jgi:regulatory protein